MYSKSEEQFDSRHVKKTDKRKYTNLDICATILLSLLELESKEKEDN